MSTIGVLGGGISGLTAAYRLHQTGASVRLLEATDRVGGVIQTTEENGFLVEHGPNSLRSTPLLEDTISELNLESERVWADETASRRYVIRRGRPVPLPTSLISFITTDLFSTRGKLRLLAEPFIRSRSAQAPEETLASFVSRRLGPEVLDYAVAPFVGGVFAGDPEHLSARHAFERLVTLEQEYGSLLWGAMKGGGDGGDSSDGNQPSSLFSFRHGLESLPQALVKALGNAVTYNAPITRIRRKNEKWIVHTEGDVDPFSFDAIVWTVPLHRLSEVEFEIDGDVSPLHGVWYPPLQVIALGYDRSRVDHPLDGFGMLVPPVETEFDILGTLFSSTLFPNRAPEDQVLLTTFVGGGRNPDLACRETKDIQQNIVERDISRLLGVSGSPNFVHTVEWSKAIPQYTLGYDQVKTTLNEVERQNPGIAFAGNYRSGISVGSAMRSGARAASRLLEDSPPNP